MKKQLAVFSITGIVLATMAQYSINWSTIDGGGGTMSGGDYTIRGTIGQPDAASMTGGGFVVRGGLWVPMAVQVSGAPWLAIEPSYTNVVISWLPANPGWQLQETSNLQSNWVDSASGSTNPIAIPISEAARFYRLRQ